MLGKTILITGSSGFIGKNLAEYFAKNYQVLAPAHSELDLLDADAVKEYFLSHHIDVVIHAANINQTRNRNTLAYDALDGNLRMFLNLAACSSFYKKMYYFGSGAEYDSSHYIPNMAEDYFGKYIPKDAYGFSKFIMSKLCDTYHNIFDLRLFGVYGKYEEYERRFISNAICRALMGKDIIMQKNVYFDYLYIDDLAYIMKWFVEHKPHHKHYNVCGGVRPG